MDEENIVELTYEDGTEERFELLDKIEYEGKDYAVMLPLDQESDEENEIVIFLTEGEDAYLPVEDDAAADAVFEIFKKNVDDNIIVLNDEEGDQECFQLLDWVNYEEKDYAILLPIDESGKALDNEITILQVESEDEDTDVYLAVEDEDLLETVFNIFKSRVEA